MTQADSEDKIFWHSRRGMLELDLLLVPFAREVYGSLDTPTQLLYQEMLEQEDQDLFAWLMRREPPSDARFEAILELILAHNDAKTGSRD